MRLKSDKTLQTIVQQFLVSSFYMQFISILWYQIKNWKTFCWLDAVVRVKLSS